MAFAWLMRSGLVGLILLTGCWNAEFLPGESPARSAAAPVTNRVEIPGPVRTNLGITFARVERRSVNNTIRVPSRFELLPTARAEHRTPLRGRIEVLVKQYQTVKKGDVLCRLDSPDWRDMQRELTDTAGAIDIAKAQLAALEPIHAAHKVHEKELLHHVAM